MKGSKLILFFCFIFPFAGCSYFSDEPIPTSIVSVEKSNKTIPAKIASYHWGSSDYNDQAVVEMDLETITVPPNSKIVFSFERKPEKIGNIVEIINKDETKLIGAGSNEIIVPVDGIHTYTYFAEWPEGGVLFAFKVEVKQE